MPQHHTTCSPHEAGPVREPIPAIEPFDRRAFESLYRVPGKPVVLKGAAAGWRAVTTWTPEYFAQKHGSLAVRPSVNLPDTEVPYQFRDVDHRRDMTLAQFVEWMAGGDRCYLDQLRGDVLPGLDDDIDFPSLGPPDIKAVVFWMGSRTCSGLHYDYADNLFAQIHGTKRVILSAPENARYLHVFPDSHTKSQIAPEHPDLRAHPRIRHATLLDTTLYPGDVLFIPKGWWHYLASSERSISLTCWHGTPLSPGHDAQVILSTGGVRTWALLARDFVWNGVLRRPYRRRLYSLPPPGLLLYDLIASTLPKRNKPRTPPS